MGNAEIPKWLKGLPFAPEFRPTDTEFADPIAYISKIEKEASVYGICKVIPPLPKPSKIYVFANLNKTLSKCPEFVEGVDLSNVGPSPEVGSRIGDSGNDVESRAVFTTRQQELGTEVKRVKGMMKESPSLGAHKQVWQSGEVYTLEQFESKSKAFARSLLGLVKDVNPLVVEALFWKAASEKPIFIEYANDVPGSGFGEPEGKFQYFSKQRRKRASYQSYRRHTEILNCKKKEMSRVNNFQDDEVDEGTVNNDQDMSLETTPSLRVASTTLLSEETVRSSKRRSVNVSSDMEGTAGWKLANSPWNLQVIARSPGSLTRFMPDDIPGVTSPMVYVGMLFSWFAWHVEDHELHSLNFMHTGSSKTWYAVPGDYAFAFEEVVRTKAYGGKIDRLAALTRLGEKTTLLSPETIVSSGIPCCRLVQNPGEFVVTFPRAYHVGFSHGFNCGEAANFGTPQWLEVAKEAAVRRAAMNYLPMLSHQQLLYLLTMSFVSRVPRSLLPGARSSRLRDRQREERELSVKKAFIKDTSRENDILSVLLEKDSCYNVVTWNPDLLPCASKEPQLPSASIQTSQKESASIQTSQKESASSSRLDCDSNSIETDLFKEMSLYMESLNGLYVDNDDLSCDFQCDSGTLACVACGILGFPFMSVVQPSERASLELFPGDQLVLGDVTRSDTGRSSTESNSTLKSSVAGDRSPEHDFSLPQNDLPVPKEWNTSSKVLRPRIFCLEHCVQIEELLQSKGGANMLIICHSDFQKMKAHATAIAEEIEHPFKYNEVPLENASQKDLNLIDLAIDVEDHDECGEDWTSKLGINLRYCVKVRKNSPSKKVHHALALGGLFSDETPSSRFLNINWQSRRSRSRIILSEPSQCKSHDNVERNEKVTDIKSEGTNVKKGKLIQYSRRKRKVKTEVSVANFEDHKHAFDTSVIIGGDVGIIGTGSSASGFSSTGNSEMLHEAQTLVTPLPLATELVKRIVGPIDGQPLEESDKHNICDVTCGFSEARCDAEATKGSSSWITGVDICEAQEREQNLKNANAGNETAHVVSDGQFDILLSRDVSMNEGSELAYPESLDPTGPIIRQKEIEAKNKSCRNNEHDHVTLDSEVQQELRTSSRNDVDNSPTCIDTLVNQTPVLMEEIRERQQQASAAEDEVQREINSASISNEKQLLPSSVDLISQPLASVNECSGTHGEPFNVVNQCNSVAMENDVQLVNQAANKLKGLDASLTLSEMDIDQCSLASVEKVSEPLAGTSAEGDLCSGSMLDIELPQESSTPKTCADLSVKVLGHSMPFSVEKCSEVPRGDCAAGDLSTDENLSTEIQQEIHSTDEMTRDDGASKVQQDTSLINDDELLTTQATQISQPVSGIIVGRDSIGEEGAHPVDNMANSKEESSTGELMTTEPTVVDSRSRSGKSRKRKNELELIIESELRFQGFIRSPCEGLRPRGEKETTNKSSVDVEKSSEDNPVNKRARKPSVVSAPRPNKEITKKPHKCNLEGCRMSFVTKAELMMHKRYQCTYEGCKKRFSSHKYAIIHQRVHEDDRPLKCPWKGCSLSFKWAWARTEHIRVHTGEKPYQCKVKGCGLSFRFVSDYSRHRRKTGHYVNSDAGRLSCRNGGN